MKATGLMCIYFPYFVFSLPFCFKKNNTQKYWWNSTRLPSPFSFFPSSISLSNDQGEFHWLTEHPWPKNEEKINYLALRFCFMWFFFSIRPSNGEPQDTRTSRLGKGKGVEQSKRPRPARVERNMVANFKKNSAEQPKGSESLACYSNMPNQVPVGSPQKRLQ